MGNKQSTTTSSPSSSVVTPAPLSPTELTTTHSKFPPFEKFDSTISIGNNLLFDKYLFICNAERLLMVDVLTSDVLTFDGFSSNRKLHCLTACKDKLYVATTLKMNDLFVVTHDRRRWMAQRIGTFQARDPFEMTVHDNVIVMLSNWNMEVIQLPVVTGDALSFSRHLLNMILPCCNPTCQLSSDGKDLYLIGGARYDSDMQYETMRTDLKKFYRTNLTTGTRSTLSPIPERRRCIKLFLDDSASGGQQQLTCVTWDTVLLKVYWYMIDTDSWTKMVDTSMKLETDYRADYQMNCSLVDRDVIVFVRTTCQSQSVVEYSIKKKTWNTLVSRAGTNRSLLAKELAPYAKVDSFFDISITY